MEIHIDISIYVETNINLFQDLSYYLMVLKEFYETKQKIL